MVTTFTPYCLFLFFHCTTGLIWKETIACAWIYSLCLFHTFYTHLLAATPEARVAVQAVHQRGFIFYQLFCLTVANTLNVRAKETCMKRLCFSLDVSRSQPVIVFLSFFCLFDIFVIWLVVLMLPWCISQRGCAFLLRAVWFTVWLFLLFTRLADEPEF